MGRYFIVSVGTSLISNQMESNRGNVIDLDNLQCETLVDHARGITCLGSSFYQQSWKKLVAWFNTLTDVDSVAKASAEMSTMLPPSAQGRKKLEEDDIIILVYTSTPEGQFCAEGIKLLIKDKWSQIGSNTWAEGIVTLHPPIPGLGSADDDAFSSVGLPHFIQAIQGLIENANKDRHQVILIPTGGYKALIPYMIIAGVLEKVPSWYVYEHSSSVLELPPLPLHVDIPSWLQMESVIEALEGKGVPLPEPFDKIYHKHLSGMMTIEGGKLKRTGLDEVFKARARHMGEPELVIRARNSPLLCFLDEELQSKFLRLAGIGHLIWKGDRVPEMIDHALRHHNDLFLLAERILLPIFYHRRDNPESFLEKHELFVLLCALFLHDCGHVIGKVNLSSDKTRPRRLLPTEVRDHHHVLGYLRLMESENHGGSGEAILNALRDDTNGGWGSDHQQIKNQYLQTIATIGLYHRKKMRIAETCPIFAYPFFSEKNKPYQQSLWAWFHGQCRHPDDGHQGNQFSAECTGSLTEVGNDLIVGKNKINFERAALLVALLRIIDGLDEQASRIGGQADIDFHLAQLVTEAKEEEVRAEDMKKGLSAINGMQIIIDGINKLIKRRLFGYWRAELEKSNNPDVRAVIDNDVALKNTADLENKLSKQGILELSSEDFEKALAEQMVKTNALSPLFEEFIHCRLRAAFKIFQKAPYAEKAVIQGITVQNTINLENKITLTLGLECKPEHTDSVGSMLQKIKKEYDEVDVKEALNRADIFLRYCHNGIEL